MPFEPDTPAENLRAIAGVYQDGDVLVVERSARLPDLCVKCGQQAHPRRLKRGFNWRHREIYQLGFYGWLGVLLLVTVARERLVLEIPLCSKHRGYYQAIRRAGYALLLGAFPAGVAWAAMSAATDADDLAG